MTRPERPVALITGARRGIGRAIASALAPDHELWLAARSEASLEDLAGELRSAGATVHCTGCDLADPAARRAWISELTGRGLAFDVLINNAGVAESAPLARSDDAMVSRAMEINLLAPFELMRAFVPAMGKRGWGRVVQIASTAAIKGYRYTSAYAASKGGLLAMTRATALEVAKRGVTINAICPGFTDTDIVGDAVENIVAKTGQAADEARSALAAFSPQQRLMTPEEIAALVAFLCSDAAGGITGQSLAVDGGETA